MRGRIYKDCSCTMRQQHAVPLYRVPCCFGMNLSLTWIFFFFYLFSLPLPSNTKENKAAAWCLNGAVVERGSAQKLVSLKV